MIKCYFCSNEFEPINPRKKYCSKKCYKRAKSQRHRKKTGKNKKIYFINKPCKFCKKIIIFGSTRKQKYCNLICARQGRKKYLNIPDCLENPERKIDKNIGYVRIYVPMHPEANTWGYVYEHRIIAELQIGRRLLKNEIVHHKNGIRWDNCPENLEVMDKIEHAKLGGQRKEDLKSLCIEIENEILSSQKEK